MDKIALVGNFPPRKCGIATFTNDLYEGIRENGILTSVIAMNDGMNKYNYPPDVEFQIEQNEITSYINAAHFLNTNNFDAVILQHEFGIFGGPDGKHITQLLKRLRIPVVTTLHTILDDPSEGQRSVMTEIANLSETIISISKKGIDILNKTYGIPSSKCRHIQHGVHETRIQNVDSIRQKLGVLNKKVLLTFGLLSRNKSIEVVINALPEVIKKHPEVVYIILGATHPHVIKHEGEEYRHSLIQLVRKLELYRNVIFIDSFVTNDQLLALLKMSDIYVIPYLGQKQISSGTLIYAMAAGKPVISTPFWYAEEMLADERGLLFDFNNSAQLSQKINSLLDDDDKRFSIANNALALAEQCYWPNIGKQYIDLLLTLSGNTAPAIQGNRIGGEADLTSSLPPLNLNHLRVMTDDTGIFQHARYTIPDRAHGYCTDDNARALMLSVMLQNDVQDTDELYRLTSIYLSFIDYAWNPQNNRFRNFMSYDRNWLEDEGSQDSGGRTMWALGYAAACTDESNFCHHVNYLFRKGLENIDYLDHPRALAYLILGLVYHAQTRGEADVIALLEQKIQQLATRFDNSGACEEWPWFDHKITYANSRIPQAFIAAGKFLNNTGLADKGLNLLDWLIEKQFTGDLFSPVGNNGWMTPEITAAFDQQPLEAHGMIDACLTAEEYVKDGRYAGYALKAFSWFTGNNLCSATVYDFATGGCRDGLHPDGVNLNQGAESTLSWLMSRTLIGHYLNNQFKAEYRS